jgi:hypothetical protein
MNNPYDNKPFEVLRLDPNTSAEQVVQQAGALRQRSADEDEIAAIRVAVQRLTSRPEERSLHELFTHPHPRYHLPSVDTFQDAFRRLPATAVEQVPCPPLDLSEFALLMRTMAAQEWQTPPCPLEILPATESPEEIQRQSIEVLWQSLLADSGA